MKKIFLIALTLLAVGGGILTARVVHRQKAQPFTVKFKITDTYNDGRVVEAETATRWRSASGAWHETRIYKGTDRVDEIYGDPVRGIFVQKNDKLFAFSETPSKDSEDATELRQSPSYVRDDVVAGVPVVVMKVDDKGSEVSLAPSLGVTLREVITQPGVTRIKEAVSVELSEPAQSVPFVPNLPADRKVIDARAKAATQTASP